MTRLRWLCGALVAGLLGAAVAADDPAPEPKRDSVPGGFRMYLVADGRFSDEKGADVVFRDERNRVGKLHDPVTEFGLNTVVAAFVRGAPSEMNTPAALAVINKQQALATKYESRRLRAFTVFLALTKDFNADDDRDRVKAQIEQVVKIKGKDEKEADKPVAPMVSVGFAEAVLTPAGDAKGEAPKVPPQVAAWGIAPEDAYTLIVYHRFKIYKRWKFTADKPPTAADLQDVESVVDEIMGKKKKKTDEKKVETKVEKTGKKDEK